MLSCANNVLTDGNTLLSDEELETLVVLRMNRGFMKFMRTHYSYLITDQHFGRTVVEADHADVVAESAGGPSVVANM